MKKTIVVLAVFLLMTSCSPMAATVGFQIWFPVSNAPRSAPRPMQKAPTGQPFLPGSNVRDHIAAPVIR